MSSLVTNAGCKLPLEPRLELTLTPYTIYALSAEDANTLNGYDANAFAASIHNHDGSDINSGTVAEAYIDGTITRDTELNSGLDGKADAVHIHSGSDITSGTVAEPRIDSSIARDSELTWGNLANIPGGFADGVDNVGGGVPSGVVVMWSGSIGSIPSGWALCDGTNGTPDLRNRFIVGAGSSYGIGNTGGEAFHTLTIAEMPSHTHEESGHGGWPGCACGGDPVGHYKQVQTGPAGGNQPHENRPPYYALAYIMRLP